MIAHVVLFKPKHDLTSEQRQAVIDNLKAAASAIPTVRGLRVGRRIRHGHPGYEQLMREDFEYIVIIEFDDVAGLTCVSRASEARRDWQPLHAGVGGGARL